MDDIFRISESTQAQHIAGAALEMCWCGQDMERADARHCPRCGTARVTRVEVTLPRLAA